MQRPLAALVLALSTLLALGSAARAQTAEGHGPGIGVEQNLGGLTGGTFVYDAGTFHVDVLFGLAHVTLTGADETDFGIGGRFFFVVHHMERADLGLGGGVAIVRQEIGDRHETNIHIEGGAQIRAFIAPNVALLASLGIVVVTADNVILLDSPVTGSASGSGSFGIGGQLTGGFGLTYYFR
jgi:hypothetical protein